jgi:hypothetical protein
VSPLTEDGVVVCDGCGLVHEQATTRIADLEEHVRNANELVSREVSKNRALRKDQNAQLTASKHYGAAMKVLESWRVLCAEGKARELGGKRLALVIARMNGGETEERLLKAVVGYSRYPFLVNWRRTRSGSKENWKADADFIFRDAKNVEAGIRLAELDEEYEQVFQPAAQVAQQEVASVIGKAALRCAGLGWQVFPCVEGKKTPATAHGLLDATADQERIAKYWNAVPLANLAIRTGQESGLIVLDVDVDKGGGESLRALEEKYGPLPPTLSVVTPSGGSHFYFRHPGHEIRNTTNIPGVGLDIRGDGGYVVAPPSQVDGVHYELDDELAVAEMPEWLVNGLREYQVRNATKGKGVWAEAVVRGVTEGARNAEMTSLVGKLVSSNMDAEQVGIIAHSINNSHCRPPLQAREIDVIISSVMKTHARKA